MIKQRLLLGVTGIIAALSAGLIYKRAMSGQQELIAKSANNQPSQAQDATIDVLVASSDIPTGSSVSAAKIKWVAWPAELVATQFIRRAEGVSPTAEVEGAIARQGFVAGEPIRREKLIKGASSGYLSAILPEGKRALAIAIDGRGASSAGGFILPNDYVDVIRTYRDNSMSRSKGGDVFRSDTVLSNVRILAIGQNIQERNGEKVISGETATLELEPRQVEAVLLAQRMGTLSLALRSMADVAERHEKAAKGSLTIIRAGVPEEAGNP